MTEITEAVQQAVQDIVKRLEHIPEEGSVILKDCSRRVLDNPSVAPPGQPPGVRTGKLRDSFREAPERSSGSGAGAMRIESEIPYATYLEHGTSKMQARPFADRICDESFPAIMDAIRSVF